MYSSPRSFPSEQGLNNIGLECNVQFRQIQDILFSPAINVFPVRRVSNPHFLADILKKVPTDPWKHVKKADSFRQNYQTPWSCWHKWVSSSSRWCLLGSLCNSARQTSLHPPKGSCHHQNHWQCEHLETTLFCKQLHRHSPYHLWDLLGSNWFCSQPPQSPGGQVETRARKFPGRNLTSQSVTGTSVQTSWLFSTQVFLFRCLGSGTKQFQMSTLKLCSPAHFFLVVNPCSWIETQNIEALFCWVLDPLLNNHREWKFKSQLTPTYWEVGCFLTDWVDWQKLVNIRHWRLLVEMAATPQKGRTWLLVSSPLDW